MIQRSKVTTVPGKNWVGLTNEQGLALLLKATLDQFSCQLLPQAALFINLHGQTRTKNTGLKKIKNKNVFTGQRFND